MRAELRGPALAVCLLGLAAAGCGAADEPPQSPPPDPQVGAGPPAAQRARVRDFWRVYQAATAARVAGDLKLARARYDSALAIDPEHADALYHLGSVAHSLGDPVAAEAAWLRLLTVDDSNARAHAQLGALYASALPGTPFDLERARRAFERALEMNRAETGPQLRLGEVALLAGDLESAGRHLEAVRRTHAASPAAHYLAGYLAWVRGDVGTAAADLGRAGRAARGGGPDASVSSEGQTRRGGRPLIEGGIPGALAGHWRTLAEREVAATPAGAAAEYGRLHEWVLELRRLAAAGQRAP